MPYEDVTRIILQDLFKDCWLMSDEELEKKRKELLKKVHPDETGKDNDVIRALTRKDWLEVVKLDNMFRWDMWGGYRILGLTHNYTADELRIPEGVEIICSEAFWQNERRDEARTMGARRIVIPKSVHDIGENAFRRCQSIEEVIFSHGREDELTIWPGAFSGCEYLSRINLPEKTKFIGPEKQKEHWAFEKTALQSLTIKAGMSMWGLYSIFGDRGPSEIVLEGYEKLPQNLFKHCRCLRSVRGLDSVTEIGDNCFEDTGLSEVSLPRAVKLGNRAFAGCTLLTARLPQVTEIGNEAFQNCCQLEEVEMPSVKKIGNQAFAGCSRLKTVSIPDTVRSIGDKVFAGCAALSVCRISREWAALLPENAFEGCGRDREHLVVHPERRPEVLRYKKKVVCPKGMSRAEIPIDVPEGRQIGAVTVAASNGNILTGLCACGRGAVTVNCLNSGEDEAEADLEAAILLY